MGLLSRKSPGQKLAAKQDKAWTAAAAAGADVVGALAVGHAMTGPDEPHAYVSLVVFPDRVEVTHHGVIASPVRQGAGMNVIPADTISGVSTAVVGGRSTVTIRHSGGLETVYWTSPVEAPDLAETIRSIRR